MVDRLLNEVSAIMGNTPAHEIINSTLEKYRPATTEEWLNYFSNIAQVRAVRAAIALRGKQLSDVLNVHFEGELKNAPPEKDATTPDRYWKRYKPTGRIFYTIYFEDGTQFYGIYDPEVYPWPA